MQITDIRVRKITNKGRIKAFVSIVFDNEFVVHDIKIIDGDDGFFIAMPSRKSPDGKYFDIVHPINSRMRYKIQKLIMDKYSQMMFEES